jgi:hypothetical protein
VSRGVRGALAVRKAEWPEKNSETPNRDTEGYECLAPVSPPPAGPFHTVILPWSQRGSREFAGVGVEGSRCFDPTRAHGASGRSVASGAR